MELLTKNVANKASNILKKNITVIFVITHQKFAQQSLKNTKISNCSKGLINNTTIMIIILFINQIYKITMI